MENLLATGLNGNKVKLSPKKIIMPVLVKYRRFKEDVYIIYNRIYLAFINTKRWGSEDLESRSICSTRFNKKFRWIRAGVQLRFCLTIHLSLTSQPVSVSSKSSWIHTSNCSHAKITQFSVERNQKHMLWAAQLGVFICPLDKYCLKFQFSPWNFKTTIHANNKFPCHNLTS